MPNMNPILNTHFNPCPELQTARLILRKASAADAEAILELRGNPEVMHYLDRPKAETIDDALEYLERVQVKFDTDDGISWGMYLKEKSEKLIGTMGLWRIDKPHYRAEIGYMLLPAFWRQGLMQEAMKACIDFGFNVINLHSIEAIINPENIASETLLKNNGFIQEAYFKENYFYNGKFLDSAVFSLLHSNWDTNSNK
jgi:[ribosomal protein S5]-alanine N-acetyltransferase